MEQAITPGFVPRHYRELFTGQVTANNHRMILAALRVSGFAKRMRARATADPGKAPLPSGKGHE